MLAVLRAHPRIARVVPVKAYALADVDAAARFAPAVAPDTIAPIETSTDELNHAVGSAWSILGGNPPNLYCGAGARVAVFDTGIDEDVIDQRLAGSNNNPDPHPAFRIGTTTMSRVEAHLQAQDVNALTRHADVNILEATTPSGPAVGLTPPFGFRPTRHHGSAGHGTAMAGIIAGQGYPANPIPVGAGHAPDAALIDVACSNYSATTNSAASPWEVSDVGLVAGVERLREYMMEAPDARRVHVLNLSVGGDPSPDAPVNLALDALARDEDVLLVACANNSSDTTRSSLGFYHGLSVGAVHARSALVSSPYPPKPGYLAFLPLPMSSRGPLASDHRRLYPDVCATGAGPGSLELLNGVTYRRRFRYPGSFNDVDAQGACLYMPGIDTSDPAANTAGFATVSASPVRWNLGTSEAAAQVSGAAALYRGFRATQAIPSSAEETRAAILLNVLGTHMTYDSQGVLVLDTAMQHTFTNRNTYGVGYVRDDLLAQFAVRDASINPRAEVVVLNASTTSGETAPYPVIAGKRYAVVACWRRYLSLDTGEEPPPEAELPNVELEVEVGGSIVAKSATPANSYERVAFIAPGTGDATIRVLLTGSLRVDQDVDVQIVAREFGGFIDPATPGVDATIHAATGRTEVVSAGSACTVARDGWSIDRIVPKSYENAYGSAPFQFTANAASTWYEHDGYRSGFDLGADDWVRIDLASTEVGAAMTIDGLAFRASAPLSQAADVTADIYMAAGGAYYGVAPPPSGAFSQFCVLRRVAPNAGELSLDNFPVQALFNSGFAFPGQTSLHIWVHITQSSAFGVDGTVDGLRYHQGLWVSYGYDAFSWQGATLHQRWGSVPIIGLMSKAPVSQREVYLETFGEPWSGNGTLQRDIAWMLTGPPNAVFGIELGFMLGSGVGSPCAHWLTNQFLVSPFPLPSTDVFGRAQGSFALPVQWVGSELGLQATILNPATLSNAARITLGGGL